MKSQADDTKKNGATEKKTKKKHINRNKNIMTAFDVSQPWFYIYSRGNLTKSQKISAKKSI